MSALMSVPAVALLAVECNARQPINVRVGEGLRVVGAGGAKEADTLSLTLEARLPESGSVSIGVDLQSPKSEAGPRSQPA